MRPPTGRASTRINSLVHWLMAILFVGWGAYFIFVLFRFSSKRNPTATYSGTKSHLSTYAEVGGRRDRGDPPGRLRDSGLGRLGRAPCDPSDEALVVRVVGEQFAWNVHYPGDDGVFGRTAPDLVDTATNPVGLDRSDSLAADDIVTINQLHLPVNRPVTIRLSSKDVIHSFGLPVMRVKQDAIPGMEIPIHFTPVMEMGDDERWEIACAQLCGLGHYRMRGFLTVESEEEFEAWLAEKAPKPAAPVEPPTEPDDEPAEESVEEPAEAASDGGAEPEH